MVEQYKEEENAWRLLGAERLWLEARKRKLYYIKISIPRFFSDEGPMLETLDYTIRIGSTPTFLYFDLYLYSAYAAHFVYI